MHQAIWVAALTVATALGAITVGRADDKQKANDQTEKAEPTREAAAGQEENGKKATDKKATVAVFSLDGPITEKPQADDFPFGTMNAESLNDLVHRMKKAASDEDISAAVILLGNTSFGTGQIEEIRAAIKQLRESDKDVYAHADSLSMHRYALLSGATKLSVAPTGDIWVNGIYGEGLYLRGLLDLLRVEPDFLTCGAYKSAAEMFMRSGPSTEAAEMHDWLFDSIYQSYLRMIAGSRGVSEKTVKRWVDRGLYSAEEAARRGIIDSAEFRTDFVDRLKQEYGENVRFDKSYAKKKGPEIDFGNPFVAFRIWGELLFGSSQRPSTKDAIAIVYVDGAILPGNPASSPFGTLSGAYSDPIRRALDKVAEDDSVKAVVLRVDSPGGSAVASEIILQATKRVKEKKPLVVSMGNVAGSGGYYVACGADTIFASSTTITGSIGVVGGKLATSRMWQRIGIHFDPIKRGRNADILSSSRVFTDEQREHLFAWMTEVYDVFKSHVTAARGDRLVKPIDELAGGRVYTGEQALELGLVDRLGGLHDAIRFVAKEAKIDEYEIRIVPKPKNFVEQLFGDLAQQKEKESDRTLSLPASNVTASDSILQAALPLLKGADPDRVESIRQALLHLEMLRSEHVLMTMPVIRFSD